MTRIDDERQSKINALIAYSPELRKALPSDLWPEELHPHDIYDVLAVVGQAIARKRSPIPASETKPLFAKLELLLNDEDELLANAAAGLLRAIADAEKRSGFDVSTLDTVLGPNAKAYLADWSRPSG